MILLKLCWQLTRSPFGVSRGCGRRWFLSHVFLDLQNRPAQHEQHSRHEEWKKLRHVALAMPIGHHRASEIMEKMHTVHAERKAHIVLSALAAMMDKLVTAIRVEAGNNKIH